MELEVRILKPCYVGMPGDTAKVSAVEFERLRRYGYAALVQYETAAKVTPNRRRGRPKKK